MIFTFSTIFFIYYYYGSKVTDSIIWILFSFQITLQLEVHLYYIYVGRHFVNFQGTIGIKICGRSQIHQIARLCINRVTAVLKVETDIITNRTHCDTSDNKVCWDLQIGHNFLSVISSLSCIYSLNLCAIKLEILKFCLFKECLFLAKTAFFNAGCSSLSVKWS